MKRRISTSERHECKWISGKVWALTTDYGNNAYCGYCKSKVSWNQVAECLQHYKERGI
jgi:hypothetical protein